MRRNPITALAMLATIALTLLAGASLARAVGTFPPPPVSNISPALGEHWAWSDVVGWIDFCGESNGACGLNVEVTTSAIRGYASAPAIGQIALNCDSTPNGYICGQSNFKISNGANGQLAGWAWSDAVGWISFCGTKDPDGPGPLTGSGSVPQGQSWACPTTAPDYFVYINPMGDFRGWAWNEVIGWISFNCDNIGIGNTCLTGGSGASDYKVRTTTWAPTAPPPVVAAPHYLVSSVFDTCPTNRPECKLGGTLNGIIWQGDPPVASTNVRFQVASASCDNGATDPFVHPLTNPTICNNDGVWCHGNCVNCATDPLVTPIDGLGNYGMGVNSCFIGNYQGGPDTVIPVNTAAHRDKQYFRYKIFLESGPGGDPIVEDVILNWSR